MRTVPVSAADYVAPLLTGPTRSAVVLAVFNEAIVVECIEPGGPMVVLLAPGASAVPLGARSVDPLPAVPVGGSAQVGGGGLTLDGGGLTLDGGRPTVGGGGGIPTPERTTFRLVRTWSSRVPAIHPGARELTELADRARSAPLGLDPGRLRGLATALRDHDRAGLADGGTSLVGLGSGSTPAGDDVLAGVLVGLHARGRADLVAALSAGIDPTRTTPYSAALLTAAVAGHAALEALAVVRRLHRAEETDKINVSGRKVRFSTQSGPQTMIMETDPVQRLLALGHTSGTDLTVGLLLGLGADPARLDEGGMTAA